LWISLDESILQVIACKEAPMSDILIVYATRGGHSRALALDLGARLAAEVREIGDLVNRKGPFGWLKSGRQAAMMRATPIRADLALGPAKTVAIVQPVWASAVCPPVRSWIRAHAAELAGRRVGVLSSDMGTPASVLRAKFESEFPSELGKLAACSVVRQDEGEDRRKQVLDEFVAELTRGR
jgi:hypothetical protein